MTDRHALRPFACRCRTQQCFVVKAGVDDFLDVARQSFCRATEQVSVYVASQLIRCTAERD